MSITAQLNVIRRRVQGTSTLRFSKAGHLIGFLILGLILLTAIFANVLAPHDPNLADPYQRLLPLFSPGYLLGTDELGRDLLSRLIFGTRLALFVAIVPTILAVLIGGTIGLLAGYIGGFLDTFTMRVFDVMFAFPGILLALGIGAALGPGVSSMVVAMVVATTPEIGRVTRGAVLNIKQEPFVESARTLGGGRAQIAVKHVLPNVLSPLIVVASMQTGTNVVLAAALSFLGLGAQPPTSDWGAMLSAGQGNMLSAPQIATFSGLAIVVLAIGFNLAGDAVRDHLDPRLKGVG